MLAKVYCYSNAGLKLPFAVETTIKCKKKL